MPAGVVPAHKAQGSAAWNGDAPVLHHGPQAQETHKLHSIYNTRETLQPCTAL